MVFLLLILAIRFFFFYQNRANLKEGEALKFEAVLLSEPQITSKVQKFSVNYNSNRISITTTLLPQYHYSDKLLISGKLNVKVLNKKREFYSINFPKIEAKNSDRFLLLAVVGNIRQKITGFFDSNLVPNYAGLLLGIVYGIKEEIPSDFLKILRNVGVMHIIAASGMNVTMTAGFISSILVLFLRRQLALTLSIIVILFYAVLAGLQASIIRASVMGIIVFAAQILGRQAWSGFILFLTGYLMLFWDPSLIYDVGFQLSFLATIGLLYLPLGRNNKNALFESLQTTIVAQAMTLPVIIANFGFYSVWSVLVNGLVLWTVPFLMVIGGVSSILSFIIEPFAKLILLLSLPILIYFEIVIKFFSGLGAVVKIEELNWLVIIGYYFLILSLALLRL